MKRPQPSAQAAVMLHFVQFPPSSNPPQYLAMRSRRLTSFTTRKKERALVGRPAMGNSRPSNAFGIGAIVGCVIILAVDAFAIPIHYEQWQTKDWNRTSGTVEDIYIFEQCGGEDGCTYGLEVEYRYDVDGMIYGSDQISLVDWEGATDGSLEWREDFVRAHPQWSSIDVYVDPNDPDRSVLITGFSVGSGAITNIVLLSSCNFFLLVMVLGLAIGRLKHSVAVSNDVSQRKSDATEESSEGDSDEYVEGPVGRDPQTGEEPSEEVGWWEEEDGAERGI